ncbi:MAG: CDP-glycerol glycerophosphotransferase family protein [Eubacteriaceae bacterium]|nr:CDP-glycerol glycerophosphotransferase family protein [Eubacteriaceae bacterium]
MQFTITDITWERLYLSFSIKAIFFEGIEFALFEIEHKSGEIIYLKRISVPINAEYSNGHYHMRLNLAIAGDEKRSFLENGHYCLRANESGQWAECIAGSSVIASLADLCRIFSYAKGQAYTFSFALAGEGMQLVMHSAFMSENSKWRKRHRPKAKSAFALARNFAADGAKLFFNIYYKILHFFARGSKNALLMSERHNSLTGNLKAIDDKIREVGISNSYRISYSLREAGELDRSVLFRIKQAALLAKQQVIFVDDVCPTFTWLKLAQDVCLVQVWHSGGGFKAVGYARFGKSGSPHPALCFHRHYTYALCGSEALVDVFQEMFGINREALLPFGIPRIDGLFSEGRQDEAIDRIYKAYPQARGKKAYLYCPTFRGQGQLSAYFDFSVLDLNRLYSYLESSDSIFMVRMHPFVKDRLPEPDAYKGRIFDVSGYPDINDLFHASDVLITDYSSAYYEFALLRKPMLFYCFDQVVYEQTRGFYQSVEQSAPGKVVESFDGLLAAMQSNDYENFKIDGFIQRNMGYYEGNAAFMLLEHIFGQNIAKGR